VFRQACTSAGNMSVLDVLVHKTGARSAKIRLDKLKQSEDDAVMNAYSDVFLIPIMRSHLRIMIHARRRNRRRSNWRRLKRPFG